MGGKENKEDVPERPVVRWLAFEAGKKGKEIDRRLRV